MLVASHTIDHFFPFGCLVSSFHGSSPYLPLLQFGLRTLKCILSLFLFFSILPWPISHSYSPSVLSQSFVHSAASTGLSMSLFIIHASEFFCFMVHFRSPCCLRVTVCSLFDVSPSLCPHFREWNGRFFPSIEKQAN